MAAVAKALGDPIRLQLVDVLRKHAGKVCVCELVPLFDLSQPTVSHHLKKLRDAGIVGSERAGPLGLLLRDPRRPGGVLRMAELTEPPTTPDLHLLRPRAASRLLRAPDKAECCEPESSSCGCSAGQRRARRDPRGGPRSLRRRRDQRQRRGRGALVLRDRRRPHRRGSPGLRRRPLRRGRARRAARHRDDGLAWLRQPDRRRRAGRRRNRPRPRLGRRHRRAALRPAGRPDRQGLRPRHDRRDAGPGAREPAQGRGRERRVAARARSSRSPCLPSRSTW